MAVKHQVKLFAICQEISEEEEKEEEANEEEEVRPLDWGSLELQDVSCFVAEKPPKYRRQDDLIQITPSYVCMQFTEQVGGVSARI